MLEPTLAKRFGRIRASAMNDTSAAALQPSDDSSGLYARSRRLHEAIRFAMQCGVLDAIVIGFKSTAEIDEAIERMNRALAEA